jgi:hypothetical protein
MAEIGFSLDLDVAANASKGGRITTGVYKVTIVKPYIYKTEKGNNVIDLELRSENGEVGFINGLCIDKNWTSGAENFDYPKWMELAAAAGMQSLTLAPMKRKTKDGEVDANVIAELVDKVVNVAVYEEKDVYNGQEKTRLKLSNTFLADGRSVAEAQAKKPAERIKKIADRLEPFETKEYKTWKNGGGQSGPVSVAPQAECAPEPAIPSEEEDALFG